MRARVAGLGGLLLSVLLVQARALPWPYNNVPSLDSLGGAICSLYGEDPLPFAANNFCNGTGFTKPDQSGYLCDILGYAEHALQAIASANASCPAAKQTRAATVSRNGVPIPYPLSDMRPLPVNLPASLLNTEGPSMYWHWKNLFNFEIWAPCAATNQSRTVTPGYVRMSNPALEWLRPVGWTVVSTQWVMDGPAQSGVYWPFATVLVNKGKHFKDSQLVKQGKHSTDSQLVIFIRGTETYLDWLTGEPTRVCAWGAWSNTQSHAHSTHCAVPCQQPESLPCKGITLTITSSYSRQSCCKAGAATTSPKHLLRCSARGL
eukprot:GHRQ01012027.1.p1 GENE.GHRQ01012027.1~~GHRQ01012027.1.p1  ORF type:complete len:319 (+),score=25.21 GHRQ01012027.1:1236-2192(+)